MSPDFRYGLDAALIALLFCAALFLVFEAGFRFGRWQAPRATTGVPDFLQQGLLTLLALLLAFGVSMAESRFEDRKAIEIDESNAIGTTYLRTATLPDSVGRSMRSLLDDYLDARIAYYRLRFGNDRELALVRERTARRQSELWELAAAFGRQNPTITSGLLLGSLNQTIDLQAKQDFAIKHRVPKSIIYLLLLTSMSVIAMVGYGQGLAGERRMVSSGMLAAVVALTLIVTIDLDRPQRGWIRLDPWPLIQLQESLRRMPH